VRVDRLYAPWRREFIESATGSSPTPCFLCRVRAAGTEHDRQNLVLHRGERAMILLNRYPYNSGHLLVAPLEHTADFARLDPRVAVELTTLTQRCAAALGRVYAPDALNVGMNLGQAAGAGVPDHLHVHVIPRWSGDTSFLPVVADTKVLPETLDQTYQRLLPQLS